MPAIQLNDVRSWKTSFSLFNNCSFISFQFRNQSSSDVRIPWRLVFVDHGSIRSKIIRITLGVLQALVTGVKNRLLATKQLLQFCNGLIQREIARMLWQNSKLALALASKKSPASGSYRKSWIPFANDSMVFSLPLAAVEKVRFAKFSICCCCFATRFANLLVWWLT
ncbi:uncharacterized protein LOC121590704 [Anopheles merus]|uniref:uncharacterized protein LOC121590699 n=1 Tax=Anopheles merus TaxID=30066 RepID=UPI001BE43EDC|nr:uncharacterized protein LOC121590699 [Anopheles merus]XP_041766542.1 uncharacterized protein LOC121590704 [Anopheles merus]